MRHRICLVVGQLTIGGLERQVYLLATGLDRNRFEVTVVSLARGGAWAEALRSAGVRVLELSRRGHLDWRRLTGLRRVFEALRPHLVYSFNYSGNAYARLAGLLAGVPVLVTGERGVEMSWHMGLLERILIRITECVICNAEAVRRDRIDRIGLPERKVMTIHNAVVIPPAAGPTERTEARRLIGVQEDEVVVGTVARLDPIKNLAMLVHAAVLCEGVPVPLRYCIVGGGPEERSLRDSIRARGMEDRFILLGAIEEAWNLLPGFDVFVLTSRSEGLPNTLMEAMAAALPCVCTDVGGCRELIEHGITGYLVPSGDAQLLAARIREVAADPDARARMGRAGRQRIASGYSVERLASQVEQVFLRLLEAAGSKSRGHRLQIDPVELR